LKLCTDLVPVTNTDITINCEKGWSSDRPFFVSGLRDSGVSGSFHHPVTNRMGEMRDGMASATSRTAASAACVF
ncbi:MAG: hypothetical protein AB8B54_14305, partial [Sphingorhabdus sp.]